MEVLVVEGLIKAQQVLVLVEYEDRGGSLSPQ